MKTINCRLCKHLLGEPILDFDETPLANEFLKESDLLKINNKQDMFPLQICCCEKCEHYQLNYTVDPERLFRHYLFVAGTSPVNVEHFRQYAVSLIEKCNLQPNMKVLDIASNDGTLLKHFKDLGMFILGIDPAKNIADEATKNGIPTISEFFTDGYADKILEQYGKFDLITANNVFAHIPYMIGFTKGIKKLLKSNGVFTFEVSYFVDVCDYNLFDTIYHEHTSYHTLKPLISFFKTYGLNLFDVERIDNHGGSIRVYVKKENNINIKNDPNYDNQQFRINSLLEQEKDISNKVKSLDDKISLLLLRLDGDLKEFKSQNKSIAIFGVPAKATTLMYVLKIDEKMIDFAVDDAPLKQGTFTPGKHIPVYSSSSIISTEAADTSGFIYTKIPDYILILAWNFKNSIIKKCKELGYKGKFITPLPEYKIE